MLDRDRMVVVFIDVQGRLAEVMDGKEALFENLSRMIRGAERLRIPILWTEQIPEKVGPTLAQFSLLLGERRPIAKSAFSCLGDFQFRKALQEVNRSQVLLVGIETHVCIYQTAMDCMAQGYEVYVVEDAVSSRSPVNKRIAIERMRAMCIQVVSVEMALFECLRDATAPEFRDILDCVK